MSGFIQKSCMQKAKQKTFKADELANFSHVVCYIKSEIMC